MKLSVPRHSRDGMASAQTSVTHVWVSGGDLVHIMVRSDDDTHVVILTPRGADSSSGVWDKPDAN